MGCDDIFKKRKARKLKEQTRKHATRKPYDRILIVCEGTKTEPIYFEALRNEYKLHTANIEIVSPNGSDPKSIVKHAQELYIVSKKEGNAFDKVYCVFDKDSHSNYTDAIKELEKMSPKGTFFAITSVPCFEYWLLLHFEYTTKAYSASGTHSIADNVIRDLKKYIPDYEKGNKDIFSLVKDSTPFAIANAERANNAAINTGTDNPTTHVATLVQALIKLKDA